MADDLSRGRDPRGRGVDDAEVRPARLPQGGAKAGVIGDADAQLMTRRTPRGLRPRGGAAAARSPLCSRRRHGHHGRRRADDDAGRSACAWARASGGRTTPANTRRGRAWPRHALSGRAAAPRLPDAAWRSKGSARWGRRWRACWPAGARRSWRSRRPAARLTARGPRRATAAARRAVEVGSRVVERRARRDRARARCSSCRWTCCFRARATTAFTPATPSVLRPRPSCAGANDPVSPEAERALQARGIEYRAGLRQQLRGRPRRHARVRRRAGSTHRRAHRSDRSDRLVRDLFDRAERRVPRLAASPNRTLAARHADVQKRAERPDLAGRLVGWAGGIPPRVGARRAGVPAGDAPATDGAGVNLHRYDLQSRSTVCARRAAGRRGVGLEPRRVRPRAVAARLARPASVRALPLSQPSVHGPAGAMPAPRARLRRRSQCEKVSFRLLRREPAPRTVAHRPLEGRRRGPLPDPHRVGRRRVSCDDRLRARDRCAGVGRVLTRRDLRRRSPPPTPATSRGTRSSRAACTTSTRPAFIRS